MKNNVARQRSLQPTQEVATVIGVTGPVLRLRGSFGEAEARRAASCLLAPALGDEVLAVFHERGAHVLAILERDVESPATLTNEGDLHIQAGGRVVVHGADGVELVTPGDASITAESMRVTAKRADHVVGALSLIGESVVAQVAHAKTIATTIETVADRFVARLERAYRFIAKNDTTRAEFVDIEAQRAFHVKAEATLVNSAGLTKIDGSQIHLG